MQKIINTVFTGILILGFYSCTPEPLLDETTPLACCGDDLPIPPPPPPPPPNG